MVSCDAVTLMDLVWRSAGRRLNGALSQPGGLVWFGFTKKVFVLLEMPQGSSPGLWHCFRISTVSHVTYQAPLTEFAAFLELAESNLVHLFDSLSLVSQE